MTGRVLIAAAPAALAGVIGTAVSMAIIDKCILFNTSASTVTATLHLVTSVGTASGANQVGRIDVPSLTTAYCPQVVGAVLSPGQKLVVIPGVGGVLNVYAAVRE